MAARPENLPRWAAGLGQALRQDAGRWVVDTAEGRAEVRFTAENAFGIADHRVCFPDGREVYIPIRVIANGAGAEVVFTLFRQPEMTDADFARDAAMVAKDLAALKALLEGS